MQKEELPDPRNRQAAGNDRPQNEAQICQRAPIKNLATATLRNGKRTSTPRIHIPTEDWRYKGKKEVKG
jgi:hypothetical protein